MTNPITGLTADEYLVFYGAAICVVVGLTAAYLRLRDRRRLLTPLPIPHRIDPYEVAYLRGGQNELTRVIIVSLVERGHLKLQTRTSLAALGWLFKSSETCFGQTSHRPDSRDLSEMERVVHDRFSTARTAKEVFAGELPALVGSYCLPLEERLQQEHLVCSDDDNSAREMVVLVGAILIGGLGVSRMLVGLVHDKPVGYLVFMLLVGLGILVRATKAKRLSARGTSWLEKIRNSHPDLDESSGASYALTAAVLGIGGLAGTPLAALSAEFKGGDQSAGGCGSGCGAGCGDGCGGCGGCCG